LDRAEISRLKSGYRKCGSSRVDRRLTGLRTENGLPGYDAHRGPGHAKFREAEFYKPDLSTLPR
jgi:hypothetical protein